MEKSGKPLINVFMKNFGIQQGCPRKGRCVVCNGNGKKCGTRSVVYMASCISCSKYNETTDGKNLSKRDCEPYIYIGETSRPVRERCIEHKENLMNWKHESFWLQHWIMTHGTETECPDFDFKVISVLSDWLKLYIYKTRGGLIGELSTT